VVQVSREAGCELLTAPRQFTVSGVEPLLMWRNGQPLVSLTSPVVKGRTLLLKRLTDIGAVALGLLLLSPVFLAIAALVKLSSPGPILYRSTRWGRFGGRIRIWKFRTMVSDAEAILQADVGMREAFESNIKLVDDPRVTPIGRFLRRWSLDELPQLWNVLVGDLSLVGPRPKLFGEERKYGAAWETVLSVRPGVTGLWQVSGRNTLSYEQRVALDVKYALHTSLTEDALILLRTLPVVVRGTGAH
jgi:lipopolysaccharide/colanic/teichoic acid biosynthesis glycosyltransferase